MKKIAKTLLTFGFVLIVAGLIFRYKDEVYIYVDQYLSPYKYVTLGEVNEYYRDYDFLYVQNTDNFVPHNRQDIINIFYTMLNAGKNEFTFYCIDEYEDCIPTVKELANNPDALSAVNNYVHPYNSFSHVEVKYDSLGRVDISVVRNYTEEEIQEINQRVEELSLELINYSDSDYNNIRRVHDYIIDHSKYDTGRSEKDDTTYKSNIAYGPLFQGMSVCGGYTDLMQLFLEKMHIKNYRVSTDNHIWNAVLLDNTWYNLDLTWDDPVYLDGSQSLEHNFFLISTKELFNIEKTQHYFDQEYYLEMKEA